jgi:hypothetical protein
MLFQNGNGPGRDTPACDSPNPPFWCDQGGHEPVATIDSSFWIILLILCIAAYFYHRIYYDNLSRIQRKQHKKFWKNIAIETFIIGLVITGMLLFFIYV